MNTVYGYIFVNSKEKDLDCSIALLKEKGVREDNIYMDKQLELTAERHQYEKMTSLLKPGDVIYIANIRCLGKNYDEILEQWQKITINKQADIVVMDMPLLDTRDKKDNQSNADIANMVLQTLCYMAKTDREFIKNRQAEGIANAKARGVKFGAKRTILPKEFFEVKAKCESGEISKREGARQLKIPYSTFYKYYTETQ